MQIIKMDKSIQDLNKIEASFCNCSKPKCCISDGRMYLATEVGTRP